MYRLSFSRKLNLSKYLEKPNFFVRTSLHFANIDKIPHLALSKGQLGSPMGANAVRPMGREEAGVAMSI